MLSLKAPCEAGPWLASGNLGVRGFPAAGKTGSLCLYCCKNNGMCARYLLSFWKSGNWYVLGRVRLCECVAQSCLTLTPWIVAARLLCPWNSPYKNTGVGSHSFLQGDLPNPGIDPSSPALQFNSLPSNLPGKPYVTSLQ